MIEALVASLCIGGYKCDMAYKAYVSNNPPIKRWTSDKVKYVEREIGKQTILSLTVVTAVLTNKPYQVRLNKQLSIGKSEDSYMILYAINF